jgi:uncharacterized phage protein (TIGR01671 family)
MSNRIIKFRAWDPWNDAMHCPAGENFVLQFDGTIGHFNGETYDTVEWVLMQWTGLKDKNGTDIYEGDIVRIFHGHPTWVVTPFEIVFQVSAFALNRPEKKGSTSFAKYIDDCLTKGIIHNDDEESALFEVIGNVHQNKNLLQ